MSVIALLFDKLKKLISPVLSFKIFAYKNETRKAKKLRREINE
jgi:hypothetical protein